MYVCLERQCALCFSVYTSILYSKRYSIFLEVVFTFSFKSVPCISLCSLAAR